MVRRRIDQDVTRYVGRPRPRPHCDRWGPSSPTERGTAAPSPLFRPCLLWPNHWMDQGATCYGGRPWHRRLYASCEPSSTRKGVQFVYAVSAIFLLPVWA